MNERKNKRKMNLPVDVKTKATQQSGKRIQS
jgi:hypothetical protein